MEFDEMLLKRKERIKEYINSENYLPLKRHEILFKNHILGKP